VAYALIVVGLLTLIALFVSNLFLEDAAEEQVVLRELVRALETNLRIQSALLVVLGGILAAVSSAGGQRALSSAGAHVRQWLKSDNATPIAATAAILLALVLLFV
jgi:hypothetical protein